MSGKKILIIGGGENQLPIIVKAKEMELNVILCDYSPDCIGKNFCDVFYNISIYDEDALLEVARSEQVDGVVSNSEPILHIISKITDTLGLPSVPQEVMERYLNKIKMRECLETRGLNNVPYKQCDELKEAIDFWYEIEEGKAIVKPLDNSSSRGVYSINSREDLEKYFPLVKKTNRRQNAVLMEKYVNGIEFTVDGICIDGKHYTLGISRKKHFSYNENVACELKFSYEDDEFDYDELRKLNDQIIEAGELTFGMTHSEYKNMNGKFYLIEACARGGGAYISTCIVPWLTDMDTVRLLIECAIGNKVTQDIKLTEDAKNRAAVLKFFETPLNKSGIVSKIEGEDFLKSNEHIVKYKLNFQEGDYIKPAENDSERIGYYIALTNNMDELNNLMDEVNRSFKIVFKE